MSTPDFLIVGAMKGGTTTLYYDLAQHADLCLPELKEPAILVNHTDLEAMRQAYGLHFRSALPGQVRGEASTDYTKRPLHEGVAERARQLCGRGLKIIYMRRDPVKRVLSQYKHEKQHGLVTEPFDEAVRRHRHLIDFSRYDWQIAPWIEAFGPDRVLQIELERYSEDKLAALRQVLAFLGVDPERLGPVDAAGVLNAADEQKHIGNPILRSFIHSAFYQYGIKPRVPRSLRERARRSILPPAEKEHVEVEPATLSFIREQLRTPVSLD